MTSRFFKGRSPRKKILVFLAITTLVLAAGIPPVTAEEKSTEKTGWGFGVMPYMWFMSMDGSVTIKGNESDVNLDFSDIWDQFNIGAMMAFEARKGKLGFYGDTIYANLGKDTSAGGIGIDPNMDVLWIHFGAFYELGKWSLSDAPDKKLPQVTLDALAGGRYTYLETSLEFSGIGEVKGDQSWVEPVVGVSTLIDLSERWTLSFEGSIGGFGAGSDFAWHALGLPDSGRENARPERT